LAWAIDLKEEANASKERETPSAVCVYTDLAGEFPGLAGATSAELNAISK
jgi:hypothetical protein